MIGVYKYVGLRMFYDDLSQEWFDGCDQSKRFLKISKMHKLRNLFKKHLQTRKMYFSVAKNVRNIIYI